jgi:putative DNA primase/helicase
LHRFRAEDDKDRNSWYVFHAGPPSAGAFGCWRRGINETWHNGSGKLSERDYAAVREAWRAADAERKRTERERRDQARKVAARLYDTAQLPECNGYLAARGVKAYGDVRQRTGRLVVPLRDVEGQLHSLQLIASDGTKRFLSGGRVEGCFCSLCAEEDGPLVIAEGYATAASVHEATAYATVAAMNCGNLLPVAKAIRAKWPSRDIIVAADNDAWTDANPGVTKATEAAKLIGAKLAVPEFVDETTKPTDFNDLHRLEGLEAVKKQLASPVGHDETEEEIYERLADLSPADYDRSREKEAVDLGIRVSTLDDEVRKRRGWTGGSDATLQGCAVDLPDPEPWPYPVDGAEVLAEAAQTIARYVVLPPGAADTTALWAAHAHCFDVFEHSPRLNPTSPEKGCGKTLFCDLVGLLAPRSLPSENMTCAILFRLIAKRKPTLIADEYDSWLLENDELRGLLNAGHKRGGQAHRCEGDNHEVRSFPVFGPVVLAGIGALPGTLHDRSIPVRLIRAKPGEVVERFDSRRTEREAELCRKLARWTADNLERLRSSDPVLPEKAYNRLADNWRPLFAIAEVAGGDWPRRAAAAFAKLTSADDLGAHGIGTWLLADVANIFGSSGKDKLPSSRLGAALAEIEGRPWAEFGKARKPITPNQLATQLRRFDIHSRKLRFEEETLWGYCLDDLMEAFDRYLPNNPFANRNNGTTPVNTRDSTCSEPEQPEMVFQPQSGISARKNGACSGVPDTKGGDPASAEADLI